MRRIIQTILAPGPTLDLNFLSGATPGNVTFSGGANGTRVDTSGTIVAANAPRFDYSPINIGILSGLLAEEERTNPIWPSSQTTHANWATPVNAVATDNVGTAPDASNTLASLIENSASGLHAHDSPGFAFVSGTSYVFSRFVKAVGARDAEIGFPATVFTARFAKFNLSNGTVRSTDVGVTADIRHVGNGLYWIWASSTCASSGSSRVATFINLQDGTRNYAGDGASGLQVWGADLQAGSFATSHTPSELSATTRSADSATFAWTVPDGSYAVEFDLNAVTGTRPILSMDDGTADNQIRLYASGTDLKLTVTTGGVTQADLTLGTAAANTTYKAAFSIRANEFLALMNGGTLQSDTAGTVPVVTTGRIGSDQAGNYQNGHSKRIRAWRQFKSNLYPLV